MSRYMQKLALAFFVALGQCVYAQNLTVSTSGQTGTSGTNWTISGNTLTVTGTADIHTSVIESALQDGDLYIVAGNINVNANITSITANALVLKATGWIKAATNVQLSLNGGDIVFWADSDEQNGGYINIASGVTLDSGTDAGGGAITLGGGSTSTTLGSGTIVPTGYALKSTGDQVGGIEFGTQGTGGDADISLLSGGGDIVLRGMSTTPYTGDSSGESNGILFNSGITIDGGSSGDITLDGQGQNGTWNAGVYTSYQLLAGNTLLRTENGDISITGESLGGGGSGNRGILLQTNSGNSLTVEATGTGTISITGTGTSHDIYSANTINILAKSGDITLEGKGDGSVDIQNTTTIGYKPGTDVTSSSSDIEIIENTLAWGGSGLLNLNTSRTVALKPYGDDFSGAFTLSTSKIGLSSDIAGLTIGKASSSDGTSDVAVTIANATTIAGPISVYGGDITVNQNLTSTASEADILLKGSGYIAMASGSSNSAYRTLQTNNGNIVLWANSADGTAGGIQLGDWVTLNSANGSIAQSTGGGKVWLAGGSGVNAQGLPTGAANGGTARSGISFGSYSTAATTTSIYSGGGDIYLNGESNGTLPGWGVAWNRTGIANAGNGTITIKGEGKNASGYHGIELGGFNGSINITAGGGDADTPAILIDGTTSRSDFSGLQTISGPGTRSIMQATGAGGITILAKGVSSGSGASYNSTVDVLANGGDILISAEGGTGLNFLGTIGQKTDTDVTSSSSNVTLRANAINVFAGTEVQTTGTLVVEPFGTSFTNALTWPLSNLTLGSGITGLTLGKEGNTANITTATAQTIAGPISIYGGVVTVNQNLTSTASEADILLQANNNIVLAANRTIETNAGDITFRSNAGGTAVTSTHAILLNNGTSLLSTGGNITLGGNFDGTEGTGMYAATNRSGGIDAIRTSLHFKTFIVYLSGSFPMQC